MTNVLLFLILLTLLFGPGLVWLGVRIAFLGALWAVLLAPVAIGLLFLGFEHPDFGRWGLLIVTSGILIAIILPLCVLEGHQRRQAASNPLPNRQRATIGRPMVYKPVRSATAGMAIRAAPGSCPVPPPLPRQVALSFEDIAEPRPKLEEPARMVWGDLYAGIEAAQREPPACGKIVAVRP